MFYFAIDNIDIKFRLIFRSLNNGKILLREDDGGGKTHEKLENFDKKLEIWKIFENNPESRGYFHEPLCFKYSKMAKYNKIFLIVSY